eukprot:6480108-Amphidinium_carterae.2
MCWNWTLLGSLQARAGAPDDSGVPATLSNSVPPKQLPVQDRIDPQLNVQRGISSGRFNVLAQAEKAEQRTGMFGINFFLSLGDSALFEGTATATQATDFAAGCFHACHDHEPALKFEISAVEQNGTDCGNTERQQER